MKYLLVFALVFVQSAFAGDNPTCEELDTAEHIRLSDLADEYFWRTIDKNITDDPKLTFVENSFMGAEVQDCYDYDYEFDNMVFDLNWKQKLESGVVQQCTQEISINYLDEVEVTDETECKNL